MDRPLLSRKLGAWIVRHPRWSDVIVLSAGMSLVLAFAPFGWWPLSLLAPAALFFIWLESTQRQVFWRGYLFGLGFFGFGVSWVYNSIHEFGHAPAALAALITSSFILFLSLYPALTGFLSHRYFPTSTGIRLVLTFPLLWTGMEWLRSWVLTGFPWLLLGQAQIDTPLAGIIPVFGILGATWLSTLIAGLVVWVFVASTRQRWYAVAAIAMLTVGWGLAGQIRWTSPTSEPLRISLIQPNIPQDMKWQQENFRPTLKLFRELTQAHWDSDVIIWPESALPATYEQVKDAYLLPLSAVARQHNTELLLGIFMYDADARKTYNSLIKPGNHLEAYHKRHLVPFGEYMPLRNVLAWMDEFIMIPMSDLNTGLERPLIQMNDYAIGVSICYEDAYGNEVIDALPEAELLVNVSNDAWFGDSLAPHQHLEIARLRALETGRYLVRATNTGISAVLDPRGKVIARSPQFHTDVLTAEVHRHKGLTPYGYWGNWAIVTLILGILLIIVIQRRFLLTT